MYEIKKKLSVSFCPTPSDVALAFCNFDQDQQAQFFNFISDIVEAEWKDGHIAMQLQMVTDSKVLTASGRAVMAYIGEYAEKTNN